MRGASSFLTSCGRECGEKNLQLGKVHSWRRIYEGFLLTLLPSIYAVVVVSLPTSTRLSAYILKSIHSFIASAVVIV